MLFAYGSVEVDEYNNLRDVAHSHRDSDLPLDPVADLGREIRLSFPLF